MLQPVICPVLDILVGKNARIKHPNQKDGGPQRGACWAEVGAESHLQRGDLQPEA